MTLRQLLAPLLCLAFSGTILRAADPSVSAKIDTLIEAGYVKNKIEPNAPASDETFVRRIYLDVIGRIPSQDEVRAFLESTEPAKRSKLIDQLLDSDGYASHWYNYWADILRLQTGMRDQAGVAYAEWLKQSLHDNMPYDKMVYQLVTAEGFMWDNGAVGYYVRDAGMPLDNMSNTTQIFLGTRLVCAQCHNHPFDKWTQKDYYQMAAYTNAVDTEINPQALFRKLTNDDIAKAGRRMSDREKQSMRRIVSDILEPLKYGVQEKDAKGNPMIGKITLPKDYKYDDADPGQLVEAKTIFGDKTKAGRDPRDHYAQWMTSTDNPRFATVIANRLWKRALGMGLIEPVDDFKDDTAASNPALMKYLSDQMVQMRFDMKRFLRVVYNTKTYQRDATRTDVPEDKPYYYAGPLLRRMSAEQIWDSVVTLVIPDPDGRKRGDGYRKGLEGMRSLAEELKACRPQAIIDTARKYAEIDAELESKVSAARTRLNKFRQDGDDAGAKQAQKELNGFNAERDAIVEKARTELLEAERKTKSPFATTLPAKKPAMMDDKKMDDKKSGEPAMMADDKYKGYDGEFFRAAELPSPAPGGHFLREFGQSNREVIENSSTEASVSQALNLMNGPIYQKVTAENTVLMQRFRGASNDEGRMNAIFQSLLGRKPTDAEKYIVNETIEEKKKDGWNDVIWALLNTREFLFIQ